MNFLLPNFTGDFFDYFLFNFSNIAKKICCNCCCTCNCATMNLFHCCCIQKQPSEPLCKIKVFLNLSQGKHLWHRCFLMNFVVFLRTPFLQNTSKRMLLCRVCKLSTTFFICSLWSFITRPNNWNWLCEKTVSRSSCTCLMLFSSFFNSKSFSALSRK